MQRPRLTPLSFALALAALAVSGCGPTATDHEPQPDGGASVDGATATPDAQPQAPDASAPGADGQTPGSDAQLPGSDGGVVDNPSNSSITAVGNFNAWALADPAAQLIYRGQGLWSADISLPAGRVDLKFAANMAWTINWGGDGQSALPLIPAQRGTGRAGGSNISFELPVGGPWRLSLDERAGVWSIAPGTNLEQGHPAPTQALIALLREVAAMNDPSAASVAARVDSFVATVRAQSPELPLVKSDVALFLWLSPTPAAGAPVVAGSFTSWMTNQVTMVSLAGRGAYLARPVGLAQRHAYKLVVDGAWQRDPLAPELEWDTIPRAGWGNFNSVFATAGYTHTGARLRVFTQKPTAYGSDREIYVYLPAGYDSETTRRYPTVYIHDGNEAITRSHFDEVATTTFAANRAAKAILVFVGLADSLSRMDEYTFGTTTANGDRYATFLANELVPVIESRYRARPEQGARTLLGMSLGGLISYHVADLRADVFGRVGGMSSSFFWDDSALIERYRTTSKRALSRCYLDSGSPNDNHDVTVEMADTLRTKGYDVMHTVAAGAKHDWPDWQARFDEALAYLLPPADFP